MKNIKIILTILLSSILLGNTSITNAYTLDNNISFTQNKLQDFKEKQYLKKKYKEMENMSIEELQNIITNTMKSENKNTNRSFIWDLIKTNVKMAWLAAAQIAHLSWYPLSAKLIENSIFWIPYAEIDWMFAKEIKKLNLYKNTLIKNKKWSSSFEKYMNPDLFYSIHSFDYINYSNTLVITDKFNFEDSKWRFWFFTNIINDWALLNQNYWVLEPIDVEIYINKNR